MLTLSAQARNLSGDWKIDNERTKSPLKLLIKGMKISYTETQLKIENISDRNGVEEVKTDVYNLDGTATVSTIANELEKSTITQAVALQGDGKIVLNANRLLSDGGDILTTLHENVWELTDSNKTLRIISYLGLSNMKAVNSQSDSKPFEFELYFNKQ